MNRVISLLTDSAYKPTKKTEQLLLTLLRFAKSGPKAVEYLVSVNAIADLIALYETHKPANTKSAKAEHTILIELLAILVTACENPCMAAYRKQPGLAGILPPPSTIRVPVKAVSLVFSKKILLPMLRFAEYEDSMLAICSHMAFGNRDVTKMVFDACVSGLCSYVATDVQRRLFHQMAHTLIELQDDEGPWRSAEWTRLVLQNLWTSQRVTKTREAFLRYIVDRAEEDPVFCHAVGNAKKLHSLLKSNAQVRTYILKTMESTFVQLFPKMDGILHKIGTSARPMPSRPTVSVTTEADVLAETGKGKDDDEGEVDNSMAIVLVPEDDVE